MAIRPNRGWMPPVISWILNAPDIQPRRYKTFEGMMKRLPELLIAHRHVRLCEVNGFADFSVYLGPTGQPSFLGKYVDRQKVAVETVWQQFNEGGEHGNAA